MPTEVVLYTRPGCHLCDEARDGLAALRDEGRGFELREVDIEGDERLHAAYMERIPVVEVAGEVVSELALDAHAVRSRLDTVAA
ncbi:MAG TPA: glutaredoxin family protein [Solirubrobacterales bacterium]|nr:glutaredoxin family protein [Solirubrobacterales bacterium]